MDSFVQDLIDALPNDRDGNVFHLLESMGDVCLAPLAFGLMQKEMSPLQSITVAKLLARLGKPAVDFMAYKHHEAVPNRVIWWAYFYTQVEIAAFESNDIEHLRHMYGSVSGDAKGMLLFALARIEFQGKDELLKWQARHDSYEKDRPTQVARAIIDGRANIAKGDAE